MSTTNQPDGFNAQPINSKRLSFLVAESHRRQFDGEDGQKVAIDICTVNNIAYEDDAYAEIESGPDPDCECAFCCTAVFRDEL